MQASRCGARFSNWRATHSTAQLWSAVCELLSTTFSEILVATHVDGQVARTAPTCPTSPWIFRGQSKLAARK